MAKSYLRAARLLNRKSSSSPDAAVYLCGYAIEIALKYNICRTLEWVSFPEKPSEFNNYQSLKTHNLAVLLHFGGQRIEYRIKNDPQFLTDWSIVEKWNPEQRYALVGTRTAVEAQAMTEAAANLLRVLL